VSTHSPELLDWVDPDDVRVVERNGGLTVVDRMSEEQKEIVRGRLMSLGDVARMEGLRTERSLSGATVGVET
jgi:alkylated DNA nucleotide flippase Atl1